MFKRYKATMAPLSEQEIQRRQNLESLITYGINPYPAEKYEVSASAQHILDHFPTIEGDDTPWNLCIAGRLMIKRISGKAAFAELQDHSGRIQLYFNRDKICPGEDKSKYNDVFKKWLDLGDFIGIEGYVFRTQLGEITVHVKDFTLLSKSIKPLPVVKKDSEGNVYDALTDPELRYRQRYVDLVVNQGVKSIFKQRSDVIRSMRNFFEKDGYVEVDTPVLQAIPGGANARPFITHHNTLDIPMYLRIANELYLKRLIVGGFDGVFEFSRNFRNEGMDRTHNPEFTVLEIYVAYKDYNWMMDYTEALVKHCVQQTSSSMQLEVWGNTIDFEKPFQRISILDAIEQHTGYNLNGKTEEEIRSITNELGIETDKSMGKAKLIDEIFGEKAEGQFIQPTFITDYPVEMSPLCKRHRDNPNLTERFELFICGKEVANAYSELNDPNDQLKRFEEQVALQARGDDEAMFIDHDYIRALEYGMPPTAGMGIGVDRLVMMLTNQTSIQEVLLFPQMRPEKTSEAAPAQEAVTQDLNDNEKLLISALEKESPRDLASLKEELGLSNKQWDKTTKSLAKKGLTKVVKTNSSLTIELV